MKEISTLLIIIIVFLSSCQKSDEYLSSSSAEEMNLNGYAKSNGQIKKCSILQIIYNVSGATTDVLQFSYNSVGNPVSITRKAGAYTGYPNFLFKYDDKERLTDFIGPYDNNNTNAEFWHKYFYDGRGNIVLDSAYIFPNITNGCPTNAYSNQLTFYTYDKQDRIIKDSTVFSNLNPVVHTYVYDANGNKAGHVYDNQVNINLTNKLWMFLNRDYSVNNPFKADSYNVSGLPSSFNLPPDGNAFWFLENVYPKAQIIYACDEKSK